MHSQKAARQVPAVSATGTLHQLKEERNDMKNKREGTLCLLTCQGVYDTQRSCFYGEHPEDRPVYDSQLVYAFNHLIWRGSANPLLVISGGRTQDQRRCSESRSYTERAPELGLQVTEHVAVEE